MKPVHIKAIMRFEHEMFGPEAWSERGYRAELADHRSRSYVVALEHPDGERNDDVDDGRLVGWAGVMLIGEDAEVLTVGTIPSARRQGVAGGLLDVLESTARERGAQRMFLEVRVDNDPAIALYAARSYVQVGLRRGYYEGGRVDAVVMRRDL